ncbi:MAG: hypothetical protein IKM34_07935 [Clostridia bacterium]|nr:hypothetical protein [Clostridia bacterium]
MKRTLAILLAIAILACSIPAFTLVSFAEGEDKNIDGLNAKIYQLVAKPDVMPYSHDRYYDIVGTSSDRNPRCSFDDTVRFANALPTLMATSKIDHGHDATGLTGLDGIFGADGYLMKWEGTVTAPAGNYTFVGRKIDNGFLAYVDQNGNGQFEAGEVYYDYASPNHWFDGGEDRLVSQQGAFHLDEGKATAIQMWYYEADGGEACQIHVSTEGGANDKSFGDAGFTFSLDRTVYTSNLAVNHDRIYEILPDGKKGGACLEGCTRDHNGDGNCSDCNAAENHKYADTIDALMAQMFLVEEKVLPTFETRGFDNLGYCGFEYEDSLIDYTGYITPAVSGTYQFGTSKVDNCLLIEIKVGDAWVNVYEFWAARVWNDASTVYYNKTLDLEAGKSYPIHVTFLEIDGGQAIESVVKIDGEEKAFSASGLKLTTERMETIPEITTQYFFAAASEWKYMTSGEGNVTPDAPANWNTDPAVSAEWATGTAPMADEWGTADDPQNHQKLWLTKTFEVEDLDAIADWALMAQLRYDDNMNLYINGKKVFYDGGWNDGYQVYKLAIKASDVLKEGTNFIAVSLVQGFGGFEFDGDLYATKEDTSAYTIKFYDIATADELVAYANYVNSLDGNATVGTTAVLSADIDMAGKDWTPIKRFIGTFDGQGHTISNLSYTATGQWSNVGAFMIDIANNNANGRVKNIVFDNCTLTVATDNNNCYAGIVAAMVDRGNLTNITVKNSKLLGNAMKAGGIVAEACWGIDDGHVIDCKVENTLITATEKAAGLVGRVTGSDTVPIVNGTVKNVTYNAPAYAPYVVDDNGKADIQGCKTTTVLDTPETVDFYYQTREGANGAKDYRVICVANRAWAEQQTSISINVEFRNATSTVTGTLTATTVYETVTATANGHTDYYEAADDAVVFGWVITGVPADYSPISSSINDNGNLPEFPWDSIN